MRSLRTFQNETVLIHAGKLRRRTPPVRSLFYIFRKFMREIAFQLWMDCLQCNEPKEAQISIFELTVFLKKRKHYEPEKDVNVHLHGSLLIQNLLQFNKPIKVTYRAPVLLAYLQRARYTYRYDSYVFHVVVF